MASTYIFNTATTTRMYHLGRYFEVALEQVKYPETNESGIKWTFSVKDSNGDTDSYATGEISLTINNTVVYSQQAWGWSHRAFPTRVGSISGTLANRVSHNVDGTKSIEVVLSGSIYESTPNTATKTWELDALPRQSTISATNAEFGGTSIITITKGVSSYTSTLSYQVGSGSIIQIISKTSSSNYSWQLPDASTYTTGKSAIITIYCDTYNGNTKVGSTSSTTITATINEAANKPTLEFSCLDINSVTTNLSKDATGTIIKGYSNIQYVVTVEPKNSASIKSLSLMCGDYTNSVSNTATMSGTITGCISNLFACYTKDSRTFETSLNDTSLNLVYYIRPTVRIDVGDISSSGDVTVTVSGTFFNGNFGNKINSVTNALTVICEYKAESASRYTTQEVAVIKSGNTYSGSVSITDLDYRSGYNFRGGVKDSLVTDYVHTSVVKKNATPVFSWDSDDFEFNVPIIHNYKMKNSAYKQTITSTGGYFDMSTDRGGVWKYGNLVYVNMYVKAIGNGDSIYKQVLEGFPPPITNVCLSVMNSSTATEGLHVGCIESNKFYLISETDTALTSGNWYLISGIYFTA